MYVPFLVTTTTDEPTRNAIFDKARPRSASRSSHNRARGGPTMQMGRHLKVRRLRTSAT